jgi:hypothetical protein
MICSSENNNFFVFLKIALDNSVNKVIVFLIA